MKANGKSCEGVRRRHLCVHKGMKAIADAMESTRLAVRFDPRTHEIVEATDLKTGLRLKLIPEMAFRFELDLLEGGQRLTRAMAGKPAGLVITPEMCEIIGAVHEQSADGGWVRRVTHAGAHGRVIVEHTLEPTDHFVQKRIRFEPSFGEPYLLRRVCVGGFRLAEPPAEFVRFVHAECRTYFVRQARGGFFFGVQLPLPVEVPPDGQGRLELAYPANIRWPAGSAYTSEPAFWGCYERTGRLAPAVPERSQSFLASTQSPIPPDTGESEAMLAMVLRLTAPSPRAVVTIYNGWSPIDGKGRIRFRFGKDSEPVADPDQVYGTLARAKEMLGEPLVHVIMGWGGMYTELEHVGPDATQPPTCAAQQQLYDWCRANGVKLVQWAPIKSPFGWEPGPWRYCVQKEDWQGGVTEKAEDCLAFREYGHTQWHSHIRSPEALERKTEAPVGHLTPFTCPACREFMHWLGTMIEGGIDQAGDVYAGYVNDEGDPWPRTRLPCAAETHDHLPGDAGYAYFRARRDLYRRLRQRYGPWFHLDAERPNQDAGVWDALYLDSLCTLDEYNYGGGDTIRTYARIRHYYHFVPSYLDQACIRMNNNQEQEYLILSALAVSNTHLYAGMSDDAAFRQTIRHWLDWARARPDIMRAQAIFLPDWPGGGACDGYLRLANGCGYAFLFNANEAEASIRVPLDESVGLDRARSYVLEYVFPEAGEPKRTIPNARGCAELTVPARAVHLLEVRPRTHDLRRMALT